MEDLEVVDWWIGMEGKGWERGLENGWVMILMIGYVPCNGTLDVSFRFRFVAHMLLRGSCSVGSVVFLGWTAVVYLWFVAVCAICGLSCYTLTR